MEMQRLLFATAALLAFATASHAGIVQSFGTDPTSTTGAFNHSLGSLNGAFDDQYTFTLDHAMTLTIASVTNVFAQPSDFITNFTGSVLFAGANGVPGGGDDVTVIGPVAATPCAIPNCQGFAGSAFLNAGNYFLDISGTANGTSGYGGNLATFGVPGPILGAGLPSLIAACCGLLGLRTWRRRRAGT
jgi:hypothetical protein